MAIRKGSREHVREGNETSLLECAARGDVGWIATGAGNSTEVISRALQFLDEPRAKAAAAKWLGHFHVNVTVRAIVVEQDAALAGDFSVEFQHPLRAALPLLNVRPGFLV